MNVEAEKIGLTQSYFDSPFGAENIYNVSTARDMCKLTECLMAKVDLRQMVGTLKHSCDPVFRKPFSAGMKVWESNKCRPSYIWENNNKLIGP